MDDNRVRLGMTVRGRRKELGLTQAEVQVAGGPSPATQRQVEAGTYTADMHGTSQRGYEGALEWQPGAFDRILRGDAPLKLGELEAERVSVGPSGDDAPSQWLTRTRSDLTDEEMEELWEQSEQVLEALKAQVLARRTRGSTLGSTRGTDTPNGSSS